MVSYIWEYTNESGKKYVYLNGHTTSEKLQDGDPILVQVQELAGYLNGKELEYKSQYNNVVVPALLAIGMPSQSIQPYWLYYNLDTECLPGICGFSAAIFKDEGETRVEVDSRTLEEGSYVRFNFYNIDGDCSAIGSSLTIRYADSIEPQSMDEVYESPTGHDYIGIALMSNPRTPKDFTWFKWKGESGSGETSYSVFKSFVFARKDTMPATPVGGSFVDPIPDGPDGTVWSDGVPAGNGLVWMSSRILSSDGDSEHQQEVWTTPTVLADTIWMDYEYYDPSKASSPFTGATPEAPQKKNPKDDYDYHDGWSNSATTATTWIAMHSVSNGLYTDDGWQIIKVKGEDATDIYRDVFEYYVISTANTDGALVVEHPLPTSSSETGDWVSTAAEAVAGYVFQGVNTYLWNIEFSVSDEHPWKTSGPDIVSLLGKDGRGVVSVVDYYAVGNSFTPPDGVPVDPYNPEIGTAWTTDFESIASAVTSDNPYIWNFEVILWTDGMYTYTTPAIISMMGNPGESSILVDMSDEMEAVLIDDEGKTIVDNEFKSEFNVFYGLQEYDLTHLYVRTGGTAASDVLFTDETIILENGIQLSFDYTTNYLTIVIPSGTVVWNNYTMTFRSSINLASVDRDILSTFKIVGVSGNELYRLVPSTNVIQHYTGGTFEPQSIYCRVEKKTNSNPPENVVILIDDPDKYLTYSVDGGAEITASTETIIPTSGIVHHITFRVYIRNNGSFILFDKETVPVIRDGERGEDGVSISLQGNVSLEWFQNYTATTQTVTDGTSYYVRMGDGTVHLFIYYEEQGGWKDLGNFKGEDGATTYLHIKYANAADKGEGDYNFYAVSLGRYLNLTSPGAPFVNPGERPGQYIGICYDQSPSDPPIPTGPDARDYTYSWQKWEGTDGYGYEYIYTVTKDEQTIPELPTGYNTGSTEYQKDDFVPNGWYDGPQNVNSTYKCCWTAFRIKSEGLWGRYKGVIRRIEGVDKEVPILYTKYAMDGTSVNVIASARGFVERYEDLADLTGVTDDDIYFVSENGLFYIFHTVGGWKLITNEWDIENGDSITVWIDGNNHIYVYQRSASPVWIDAGIFNGKSGYVHIKYADDYYGPVDPADIYTGFFQYLNSGSGATITMTPLHTSEGFTERGEYPGRYQGVYTDENEADSLHVTSYTWTMSRGKDGFGYEYFYKPTARGDQSTPKVPETPASAATIDDWVPEGWQDDMPPLSENYPRIWMCYRVSRNGLWSDAMGVDGKTYADNADAILQGQYGKDGTSINLIASAAKSYKTYNEFINDSTKDVNYIYCVYDASSSSRSMFADFYSYKNGAWAKIVGKDGDAYGAFVLNPNGEEGNCLFVYSSTAGSGGEFVYGGLLSGKSSYLHVKYADAAQAGETGAVYVDYLNAWIKFTQTSSQFPNPGEAPGRYMGVANDESSEESQSILYYTWHMAEGYDGFGYEYIYKLTSTYEPKPTVPQQNSQDDDFVPTGWSDNPLSITNSLPYRWMCYRKKDEFGVWSNFMGEGGSSAATTSAILDGNYGDAGCTADLTNERANIQTNSSGKTLYAITTTTQITISVGSKTISSFSSIAITKSHAGIGVTTASTGVITITIPNNTTLGDRETVTITATGSLGSSTYTRTKDFEIIASKGLPTYEIIPLANTIVKYKNNGGYYPSVMTIKINKYDGSTTPVDVTNQMFSNRLVTIQVDEGTPTTLATNSYRITNDVTKSLRYNVFTLENNSVLGDTESIPIVSDGEDGTGSSPIVVDFANEIIGISVNENGYTTDSDSFSSKLYVYSGDTQMQITAITRTTVLTNITTSVISTGYTAEVGFNVSPNAYISTSSLIVEFDVKLSGMSETYKANIALAGMKQGENGESPIIYDISASTGQLIGSVDDDGDVTACTPSSVSFQLVRRSGNTYTEVTTRPDNIWLGYSNNFHEGDFTSTTATTITLNWANMTGGCRVCIKSGDTWSRATIIDRESVPIVKDGKRGKDGIGISSIREYYCLTQNMSPAPQTGTTAPWTTGVTTPTSGSPYLWNFEYITYENGATASTSPAMIGMFSEDGRGIVSVVEWYCAWSSNTSCPSTGDTTYWTTNPSDNKAKLTATNKYLWNFEVVNYTSEPFSAATPPAVIGVYGDKGDSGIGISSIKEYYRTTQALSPAPATGTSAPWSTATTTPSSGSPYLWNFEYITYDNGATAATAPSMIGMYSKDGKGIVSVVEWYCAWSSNTSYPATGDTTYWTTNPADNKAKLTSTKRYLWNYEVVNYTVGDPTITIPAVIGVYGDKGDPGEVTDLEYLTKTFGSGLTITSGATINGLIGVYDGTTGVTSAITAFMNGIRDISGTTEQGRLMFAAGVNGLSQANNAKFRVYENGDLYASNVDLSGTVNATGGTIGSLVVSGDTVFATATTRGNEEVVFETIKINRDNVQINNLMLNGSYRAKFKQVEGYNEFWDEETKTFDPYDPSIYAENYIASRPGTTSISSDQNNVFRWSTADIGRRINVYHSNGTTSTKLTGSLTMYAKNQMYFFEDGIYKPYLKLSNEYVTLIGYGNSSAETFYGYIVVARENILTKKRYGHQDKAMLRCEISTSNPYVYNPHVFDGSDITTMSSASRFTASTYSNQIVVSHISIGCIAVKVPKEWYGSSALDTQKGLYVDITPIANSTTTPIIANLGPIHNSANGAFFYVYTYVFSGGSLDSAEARILLTVRNADDWSTLGEKDTITASITGSPTDQTLEYYYETQPSSTNYNGICRWESDMYGDDYNITITIYHDSGCTVTAYVSNPPSYFDYVISTSSTMSWIEVHPSSSVQDYVSNRLNIRVSNNVGEVNFTVDLRQHGPYTPPS